MSKWQPIETAPKDGKPYLFYVEDGEYSCQIIASWAEDIGWMDTNYICVVDVSNATHWAPMPEDPGVDNA